MQATKTFQAATKAQSAGMKAQRSRQAPRRVGAVARGYRPVFQRGRRRGRRGRGGAAAPGGGGAGAPTISLLPRPDGTMVSASPGLSHRKPPALPDAAAAAALEQQQQQQQLQLIPDLSYVESRATAVTQIESQISELGQIFQKLASMVNEQEELVMRIDTNTEMVEDNVRHATSVLNRTSRAAARLPLARARSNERAIQSRRRAQRHLVPRPGVDRRLRRHPRAGSFECAAALLAHYVHHLVIFLA